MNGGFEYPPLPSGLPYLNMAMFPPVIGGWTIGPSRCATGTDTPSINLVTSAYWDAAEGVQSIDLNGDDNTAPAISQTIVTVPGFPHRVSWQESANYEAGPAANMSYQFSVPSLALVSNYTVAGNSRRSARNMMYAQRSVDFVATGAETEIRFDSCMSGDKGAVLDAVTLNIMIPTMTAMPSPLPPGPGPAPAAAATSGGGLTGGEAAGISIGVIAGAGLLVFLIYMLRRGGGSGGGLAAAKAKVKDLIRDWKGGATAPQDRAVVYRECPLVVTQQPQQPSPV